MRFAAFWLDCRCVHWNISHWIDYRCIHWTIFNSGLLYACGHVSLQPCAVGYCSWFHRCCHVPRTSDKVSAFSYGKDGLHIFHFGYSLIVICIWILCSPYYLALRQCVGAPNPLRLDRVFSDSFHRFETQKSLCSLELGYGMALVGSLSSIVRLQSALTKT